MDAFGGGWSTVDEAEPCMPSRPGDDDLLSAFLYGSFDGGLPSEQSGGVDLPPSYPIPNLATHCHDDGAYLSDGVAAAAFMGIDTAADVLRGVTGVALDDGLVDTFEYVPDVVAEEPAQTNVSTTAAFSGYSSSTGGNGGNVSSGESNTCGGGGFGHDMEVASPCAAARRPALAPPPSKRKADESYSYPALVVSATTATEAAAARRGAKRPGAATSSSSSSTSIAFRRGHGQGHRRQAPAVAPPGCDGGYEPDAEAIAQVKEMVYRAAAMRPVHQLVSAAAADAASPQGKPRRKNVRISSDPQTVAARLRRERVSARLRVLQRLVPGGSRMDTASMLDEAASYLRFLKSQLKALESAGNPSDRGHHHDGGSLQSYTGGVGGSGAGASSVLAFGRDAAIGGYVKSNRNMQW